MFKSFISLFMIFCMINFAFSGNVKKGSDQTDKRGYRPGVLVVKYKSTAALSQSIKVSKNGSRIAQLGISSLDQLHQQLNVLSVSKDELYQPKDKSAAINLGIDRTYLLNVPQSADIETIAKQYAADPNVEYATPDWEVYPAVIPNDPNYSKQWGHNNTAQMPGYNWSTNLHNGPLVGTVGFDANAEAAWGNSQGFGSSSIVIAIIDGGVEWSHPDLAANIWTNPGESGGGKETNGIDDDGNGKIDDYHGWDFGVGDNNPNDDASGAGHGTCCSGIAAAVANNSLGVAGIAAGCKIMPLKGANAAGSMYFSSINSAITYAADMGAKVISMSLGASAQDAANQTACTYAWNKGAIVLAATGNENNSSISYPAGNTNVVGVGAASNCGDRKRSSSSSAEVNPGVFTDPNGYTCDGERWWGSNYGSTTKDAATAVDVIAPTILPTTDRVGANGYETGDYDLYFNGTSCATPYAAGVAALIFSKNPTWTAQQVRDQLCNTAQDIVSVESVSGWDRYTGYGMVDAAAATAGAVQPSISVTSPNGGETWAVNTSHSITWTSTGTIANVKIEYTTDGTNFTVITASATNNGTFSWTVPSPTTTTAKVKISDVANAATTDLSNANFTISAADVTPPVTSNVLAIGITANSAVITWTTDEASSSVVNYGLTTAYGSTTTGSNGVTSHSVSLSGLTANTLYHYRVTSTDASGNTTVDVDHSFQTGGSFAYAPSSTTITSGTLSSGSYTNLAGNDASYYVLNSTKTSTRKCDWYGGVTITQAKSSVTKLTVVYDGKYSRNRTQVLYLYNWTNLAWVQIDSRTVSTTDVTVTNIQTSPANYISSTGQIQLRVYTTGGSANYTSSADYMRFTVETGGASVSKASTSNEIALTPSQFRLHPSFPNPFNPSTTIRYELADNSLVTIKVYDVIGQEVATLINNEQQQSGVHDVRFNASSLASGIYYYRLTAYSSTGETFTQTQKLSLLK
jgi:subtilisin family serine protease